MATNVINSREYSQGAGGLWVPNTSTALGTKNAVDVNLAASASGYAVVAGSLTAAVGQTTGGSASTTAMVVAPASAAGNATVTINTSAFVGTISFEGSDDGGTTYYTVAAAREDGSGQDTLYPINTAALLTRMWTIGLPGVTHFRVRCHAFTSGTVAVRIGLGAFLIEPNPIVTMTLSPSGTTGALAGNIGAPAYLSIATATATSLVAAPGAGLSIYVTDMEGSNSSGVATRADWTEGVAGTVRYSRFMAASGGGFVTNLKTPWKLPANTALGVTQSAANQGYYSANYYIGP